MAVERPSSFDIYHPGVALLYLVCAMGFTMVCRNPLLAALSVVFALAYGVYLRGWRATLRTLAWQVPLLAVITLANPIFSQSGSTVLLRLGTRAFYFESLTFGFSSGLMLMGIMLWFSNGSRMLTSDKVLMLGGRVMPTVSLMVAMSMRLVPQFVRRGGQITDTQRAVSAARICPSECQDESASHGKSAKRALLKDGVRSTSVLMGWGMEDSLDMADAMRARGWGAAKKRTSYQLRRMRAADVVALGIVAVLAAVTLWTVCASLAAYSFYPRLSGLGNLALYVPSALFFALPLIMELGEWIKWR